MYKKEKTIKQDSILLVLVLMLVVLSLLVLNSIAKSLFPGYYLYTILGLIVFFIFSKIDFSVWTTFSKQLYFFSIFLLTLPLLIGQVTRGAIRWIPIGSLTIQPAEIVRPFLLVFFSNLLVTNEHNTGFLLKALLFLLLPILLIIVQPSLGVAVMTAIGIFGVLIASGVNKKHFVVGIFIFLLSIPASWFLMADYQKQRVLTFLDPSKDPLGAGYNSIQSMISVGSGGFLGKGLGRGVQTQLAFLPEKHSDFIFAAVSEEMGMIGAIVLLLLTFALLIRIIKIIEHAINPVARAFASGLFLTLFVQIMVHVGMNMGLVPITGLPYPLVSAGGSSFIATMMGLGIAVSAKKT